ncbi:MAG: hypothetical protein D6711_18635, partial [Chloroflexi bacterium]
TPTFYSLYHRQHYTCYQTAVHDQSIISNTFKSLKSSISKSIGETQPTKTQEEEMTKKNTQTPIVAALFVATLLLFSFFHQIKIAAATTGSPVTIDCNINIGTEWQADEKMAAGGMSSGDELYITWDANYLYIGIKSTQSNRIVMIDTTNGGSNTSPYGTYAIASGGGTGYPGFDPTGYPAPSSNPGYEHAFIATSSTSSYKKGTTGTWNSATPPSGTNYCTNGSATEYKIPFSGIGIPPASRMTILVITTSTYNYVSEYWPSVSGNRGYPPSFTKGLVFTGMRSSGISPASAPTAVSLQRFNIQTNNWYLFFTLFTILIMSIAIIGYKKQSKLNS